MKTRWLSLMSAGLLAALAGCSTPGTVTDRSTTTEVSVRSAGEGKELFNEWNRRVMSGDAEAVADLYTPDAVLLPTVSGKARYTRAERIDYFEHFLAKKPRGLINHSTLRRHGDLIIDSGLYTFRFADGTQVRARYTFVYRKQADGRWLIIEHHSSRLPEG